MSLKKLIDLDQLSRFKNKIDAILNAKLDTTGNAYRSSSIPMGKVDTTSVSTAFTATVPGITELRDGVCMWLRNGVVTSAEGFTININNLGAKPCYSSLSDASRATAIFSKTYTLLLVYNSTRVTDGCWDIVYGIDSNTTYSDAKLGFVYVNGNGTSSAVTGTNSSYSPNNGGIVVVRFLVDVAAGATLNINSKGAKAIYTRYRAIKAGEIQNGDTCALVYYDGKYHMFANDRWPVDIADVQTHGIVADQGIANAGKFLIVGSDGIVVPTTLTSWQGGSY